MLLLVTDHNLGSVLDVVRARMRDEVVADPTHAAEQMVDLLLASERDRDSIRRLQTKLRQAELSASVGLEWVTAMVDVARDLGVVVDGAAAPTLAVQMRAAIRALQERIAVLEHEGSVAEAAE